MESQQPTPESEPKSLVDKFVEAHVRLEALAARFNEVYETEPSVKQANKLVKMRHGIFETERRLAQLRKSMSEEEINTAWQRVQNNNSEGQTSQNTEDELDEEGN